MSSITKYRLSILALTVIAVIGLEINPFRHIIEATSLMPFGAALVLSFVRFSRLKLAYNLSFSVVSVGFYFYALLPWFTSRDDVISSSSTSALDLVMIPSFAVGYGFISFSIFVVAAAVYQPGLNNR